MNSTLGRVVPGRFDDFLLQAGEACKLFERLGASNARISQAIAAGEAYSSWVFTAEFPDMESYGGFVDDSSNDEEFVSFVGRLQSVDNPVTVEQLTLGVEVPLERKVKAGRGPVSEVHVSSVAPGRLEDAIDIAKSACTFVERHGARNGRLYQLSHAGSGSRLFLVSWEFASMRAFGKASDAWASDPRGQKLLARLESAENPSTIVFSGVYQQLPV